MGTLHLSDQSINHTAVQGFLIVVLTGGESLDADVFLEKIETPPALRLTNVDEFFGNDKECSSGPMSGNQAEAKCVRESQF